MSFEIIEIESQNNFQQIKIPEKDDKVYLKKTGNVIYIIPFNSAWESLTEATNNFSDDFMEKRVQPFIQNRETFGDLFA